MIGIVQRGLWNVVLLTPLMLALAGCSLFGTQEAPPRVCTLMGCVDSLVIDLVGQVPDEFTVEVIPGEGGAWEVRCAGDEAHVIRPGDGSLGVVCRPGSVVFFEVAPEEVAIRVTWEGDEVWQSSRPAYESVRPNGPDCPPECRVARVTVEMTPP
jgi:hypothetical protein